MCCGEARTPSPSVAKILTNSAFLMLEFAPFKGVSTGKQLITLECLPAQTQPNSLRILKQDREVKSF